MDRINIGGAEITMTNINDNDYICISDIARLDDNDAVASDRIKNWMRNKNTVEFLGLWEELKIRLEQILLH